MVSAKPTRQRKAFSLRRSYRRLFKKLRSRYARYAILGANVALLFAVVFFVTNNPDSGLAVRQAALVNAAQGVAQNPLDQLSSADIAVHAARLTDLPEVVAVTNQADSEATQLAISGTENKVIAKPQIVTTAIKSAKDIQTYVAVEGDTVSGLATRFGVTSDSIRWSNGLTSDRLTAGQKLVIPPVNGLVYTVKAGDTPDSIAQRYSASKDQILADNDAEVAGLQLGRLILIRGGIQATSRVTASFGFTARYGYNGYVSGYCTWYAASRVSIPTNWGNARDWASSARLTPGWTVSVRPVPGAIAQTTAMSYLGHVGIVEEVSPDGTMIKYSDMNGIAGFGAVGHSGWVPATTYQHYIYR